MLIYYPRDKYLPIPLYICRWHALRWATQWFLNLRLIFIWTFVCIVIFNFSPTLTIIWSYVDHLVGLTCCMPITKCKDGKANAWIRRRIFFSPTSGLHAQSSSTGPLGLHLWSMQLQILSHTIDPWSSTMPKFMLIVGLNLEKRKEKKKENNYALKDHSIKL